MKMAEFAEGCNGKDIETCGGISQVKKKFLGVSKHGNKWQARVRDLKLKVDLYFGCYHTPEEAAVVVEKKRAEIQEKYNGVDARNGFDGVKFPYGVRWENGRCRVRIPHPKLKNYNPSFGFYDTCEEAAAVAQMKRAELQGLQQGPEIEGEKKSVRLNEHVGDVQVPRGAKTTKDPFDGSELESMDKPGSKPDETSVKLERELEYNSPATSLVTDCLNNVAPDEQSNHGHGYGHVHSSPTSVFYVGNSNTAYKTHALDFNKEASLSVVNEYGQLLGEFGELDEQMWLNLPD